MAGAGVGGGVASGMEIASLFIQTSWPPGDPTRYLCVSLPLSPLIRIAVAWASLPRTWTLSGGESSRQHSLDAAVEDGTYADVVAADESPSVELAGVLGFNPCAAA
jgi:hypothetical protein